MLLLALTILTFSATPTKLVVHAAIQSITPRNEFARPNGIANNEKEEKDGLASSSLPLKKPNKIYAASMPYSISSTIGSLFLQWQILLQFWEINHSKHHEVILPALFGHIWESKKLVDRFDSSKIDIPNDISVGIDDPKSTRFFWQFENILDCSSECPHWLQKL